MNENYIDSLKIFELISTIEKKFKIKVSQNDLQKIMWAQSKAWLI